MIQPHDSIIVRKVSHILVPFIQLFALYVFFHGHHSPGGGFQGGVLIGASIILQLLVGSTDERKRLSSYRELIGIVVGLSIYAGLGCLSLMAGAEYLNYGEIAFLGQDSPSRHFMGILGIELGVMIVVAMTLVIIFRVLSGITEEDTKR